MDDISTELKTLAMGNIASFEVACEVLSLSQGISLFSREVSHAENSIETILKLF